MTSSGSNAVRSRLARIVAAAVALSGLGLAAGAMTDAAQAVTNCPTNGSTSWTNAAGGSWDVVTNWSNGVPGLSCTVDITLPGTYTVSIPDGAGVLMATLGGASGTQTLQVVGTTKMDGSPQGSILSIGPGGLSIGTHGVLQYIGAGSNPGEATTTNAGTITNSGLIRTDQGSVAGTRDIQNNVTNNPSGMIALHTNTITCGCGNTHHWLNNGTITTDAGTTSTFSGTAQGVLLTQSSGTFVNNGRAEISGGYTLTGGTTTGNPIDVCGFIDSAGPGAASFEVQNLPDLGCNGATLVNDVGPGTSVLVHSGATTSAITVTTAITNHGTITLDGGPAQPQLNGQAVANAGTIAFAAAPGGPSAAVQSTLTNTGAVSVAPGSSASLNHELTQGAGTISVGAGGTLNAGNGLALTGGTITNSGAVIAQGPLDHTGGSTTGNPIALCGGDLDAPGPGTASFVIGQVAGCSTMGIDGDIGTNDTVRIQAPDATTDFFVSSFTNHGHLAIVSDAGHLVQLHNGTLTNDGTLSTTGSNLATTIINNATWNVLAAPGLSTNDNQPITQAGGTLAVTGTLNAGNGLSITGGTITNTGSIVGAGPLSHTGGGASGNPIALCGGDLDAPGPGTASFVIGQVAGCSTMGIDGDIGTNDTVRIQAPDATTDFFVSSFTNHGHLAIVSDAGHLVQLHNGTLTNDGTLSTTGSNLATTIINNGTWNVLAAPGLSTNDNQPITQAGGTLTVDGQLGGDLTITGGVVRGGGTINTSGTVSNTGGTVRPTHTLSVNGGYTQGAGGALDVDVAGSTHSALAVSGAVTLDGALHAATTSVPPGSSGTLHVLTAGTVSGTFAHTTFTGQAYHVNYLAGGVDLTFVRPPLALTGVGFHPTSFRAKSGTKLDYRLSTAATLSITFKHSVHGHIVGALHTTAKGSAGSHAVSITTTKLKPGKYTVTISARDSSGRVVSVTRKVTVLKPKKHHHT